MDKMELLEEVCAHSISIPEVVHSLEKDIDSHNALNFLFHSSVEFNFKSEIDLEGKKECLNALRKVFLPEKKPSLEIAAIVGDVLDKLRKTLIIGMRQAEQVAADNVFRVTRDSYLSISREKFIETLKVHDAKFDTYRKYIGTKDEELDFYFNDFIFNELYTKICTAMRIQEETMDD